jgi:hypothetical protein
MSCSIGSGAPGWTATPPPAGAPGTPGTNGVPPGDNMPQETMLAASTERPATATTNKRRILIGYATGTSLNRSIHGRD